ncbi:MAG: hypothetical protein ACK5JE_13345 [Castellaniella sp.]|uniref:hypothetical protein n=1 Tax=Castellaniella sp. TaxID=1955812 RepID=UPI003A895298
MVTHYSASSRGFYSVDLHGNNIPKDAVEITEDTYASLMQGQSEGRQIVPNDKGYPVLENPPAPKLTLAEIKAVQLAQVNHDFERHAQALTAGYPEAERLTWPTQQAEALAWAADNAVATPYLDGLAKVRGVKPEAFRKRALVQVHAFQAASQKLVGTRQRLADQISAAKTLTDVEKITWPI